MPKKDCYWDRVGEFYLVYQWSDDYNRFVCTHKYDQKRDAELTVRQRTNKRKRNAQDDLRR